MLVFVFTCSFEAVGMFGMPLSEAEKTAYMSMLRECDVETLGAMLANARYDEKKLILDELSVRDQQLSLPVIEEFIGVLSEKLSAKNLYRPVDSEALYGKAITVKIRLTATNEAERIACLEKHLVSTNSFLVGAVAWELYLIGSAPAREALARHESKGPFDIKICRIRMDIKDLPDEKAVEKILEEARKELNETDGKAFLVAEGTVINGFSSKAGFSDQIAQQIKLLDDKEKQQGKKLTRTEWRYKLFLEDIIEDFVKRRKEGKISIWAERLKLKREKDAEKGQIASEDPLRDCLEELWETYQKENVTESK
jgi:hypothetical protein